MCLIPKRRFQFLEHTADIYIAAYGKTLEEAFENAALATFQSMTDTDRIAPQIEEELEVDGFDEKALLYNWIEALIIKFETTYRVYSEFEVTSLSRVGKNYHLCARIRGEKFDSAKHPPKVGIKAVTYHQMEIIRGSEYVTVKFILDI
ncbi:MAG: archease [Candidatus Bathyarchaeota archaeon]|nr:MAG: archease [Candidatus Bathyarchaeota archaeon]